MLKRLQIRNYRVSNELKVAALVALLSFTAPSAAPAAERPSRNRETGAPDARRYHSHRPQAGAAHVRRAAVAIRAAGRGARPAARIG